MCVCHVETIKTYLLNLLTFSPIRGSKIPERIVMKFCMVLGLPDIVIRAKLSDDRFSHFCVVSGRISGFPIDFGCRPYNSPHALSNELRMNRIRHP